MSEEMDHSSQEGITLLELYQIIRKYIIFIFIAMAACIGLAFGYTRLLEKPSYTATTSLIVKVSSANNTVDAGTVSLAKSLAQVYQTILLSDRVMTSVADALDLEISASGLKGMVDIEISNSSIILTITATSKDPSLAVAIPNQIAETGIGIIETGGYYSNGNIDVLDAAVTSTASRNTAINLAIGLLIGALISVVYVLFRETTNRTLHSRKDIEKITNIPIIGLIPNYEIDSGRSES